MYRAYNSIAVRLYAEGGQSWGDSMMSANFAWDSRDQTANEMLTHRCPQCEETLTLHQPDEELADRLLATCDSCKSWFLTDSELSAFVPLPDLADDAV
jgi:hypothetical protein